MIGLPVDIGIIADFKGLQGYKNSCSDYATSSEVDMGIVAVL
jgi:hypothetical protein